jgi:hypothetical protein
MASATTDTHLVSLHAHQQHDTFNLLLLPIIVLVNIKTIHTFFLSEHAHIDESAAQDQAWNLQIGVLCCYILCDTIWILFNPDCVAALKTILLHHCVVFFGWLLVPHQVVEFRKIATCLLSVEINTVFMIARKYSPFQKYPSLVSFFRTGFYATWIPLRTVIFPYCCYLGFLQVVRFYSTKKSYLNVATVGWVLLLFITALNVKWTYDLFFTVRRSGISDGKKIL